jgi:hypothetical protein
MLFALAVLSLLFCAPCGTGSLLLLPGGVQLLLGLLARFDDALPQPQPKAVWSSPALVDT